MKTTKTVMTMAEFIRGNEFPPTIHGLIGKAIKDARDTVTRGATILRKGHRYLKRVDAGLAKAKLDFSWSFSPHNCYAPVTVVVNGDKDALAAVFKVMRRAGFEPSTRPDDKPRSSFFCTWTRGNPSDGSTLIRMELSFYSTVCEYKQVGTKMQEVPVYEIRCK